MKKKRLFLSCGIALVIILLLVGGVTYFSKTYTVQTVYVEGNVHYTQDEIKEMVMTGFMGDNSLVLSWKYKNKGIKDVPFVDVMDVSVLAPDTIKITVYEKALAGYVEHLGTNMYFDKDGYVVENSSVITEGVPLVTGLEFDHAVLGEALPVSNQEIFNEILKLTNLLKKYSLETDRIHFKPNGEMFLYFDNVKVSLGVDDDHLEDKLMLLPKFLPSLAGKAGTLEMSTYDEMGGKYAFVPENF